jgi:hypothetical protein
MKLTVRLKNGTSQNCFGQDDYCGPGYYCGGGNKCADCHGSCDWCDGSASSNCTKCSRFSKQWQVDSNPAGSTCTLEYFNANLFNAGYTFTNIPPIKTGRVTLGVWLYINNLGSAQKYMHFVVTDNIVMTVETSSSNNNVTAYCSRGQLYHTFLSNPALENTTSNGTFTTAYNALNTNKMIVSTTTNTPNGVQGRWFYLRCAVNRQNKDFYIMHSYNKGLPYNTSDNGSTTNASWQDELIYSGGIIQTDMRFYKYYRSGDTISVKIKNVSSFNAAGMDVYIRNLYVFNEYIPKTFDKLQYL